MDRGCWARPACRSRFVAGLDQRLRQLQSVNSPEVFYPVDYIRNVDRGRIAIGQFDVAKEIGPGGKRSGQHKGRPGPVRQQDRRLQAALPVGRCRRDHALSRLCTVELQGGSRLSLNHRPSRKRPDGRQLLYPASKATCRSSRRSGDTSWPRRWDIESMAGMVASRRRARRRSCRNYSSARRTCCTFST